MKRIAILGAGIYNIGVYKKITEAGFYAIAVDGDPHAPAASAASEFVNINFTNHKELLAWASNAKLDGIMALNDHATMPAAYVSEQLNLPGISSKAALRACDKGLMRQAWKEANLPVPAFFVFTQVQQLIDNLPSIGFPCVVKPTFSGGGGRGISVLHTIEDAQWAYDFAKPHSKTGEFICEQFVEGTELTIEAISDKGKTTILAISDKVKPNLRTRVATSLHYPADLSTVQEQLVIETVTKAIDAIGITTGMSHTEVIICGNQLQLVELGARGGGSMIFPFIIESVSGICAPVQAANIHCNLPPELNNIEKRGTAYRFFNPPYGVLKQIVNAETVANWPEVIDIGFLKKPGDVVGDLKNSFERAGHVVIAAPTREQAIALADKAEQTIQFVLQ